MEEKKRGERNDWEERVEERRGRWRIRVGRGRRGREVEAWSCEGIAVMEEVCASEHWFADGAFIELASA